jgi:quercetin dioxygenase-like cupin family protein
VKREDEMFTAKQKAVEPKANPSVVIRLREITGELARDPMTMVFNTVEGGDCIVRSLLSRENIGVVDAGIPEGHTFPEHAHAGHIVECLMIYQGRALVEYKYKKPVTVDSQDIVCFCDGELHRVTAVKGYGDVRLIGITIPRDEGFPGATK